MNVTPSTLRLRAALPACALVCTALLVTACSGDEGTKGSAAAPTTGGSSSPSPGDTSEDSGDLAELKALLPAAKITWDKAAGTAVGEVSGSELIEIDLTRFQRGSTVSPAPSPGSPEWAAEVATKDGTVHRVLVDAVSGRVLQSEPETDQDADDKRAVAAMLAKAEVTAEQAVKTATGKQQGTVTDVHLDSDDNTPVWSVDLVDQNTWSFANVDIDATNGEVRRAQVHQVEKDNEETGGNDDQG
ncbi:PepSY domain-containing protein [Streptomyces sp. NPDC127084]|uniref:PepSY domain-containing protein n=1 Tax=Streptomyces sp. NPDC127084 TaxID=3347133 RepID=UPI0036517311